MIPPNRPKNQDITALVFCFNVYLSSSRNASKDDSFGTDHPTLHSKYINKSIKGLLANVSEDGKVMNVSGGTAVMRDKEGYRGIPKAYIQGWGQGLALSFFATLLVSDEIQKDGAL